MDRISDFSALDDVIQLDDAFYRGLGSAGTTLLAGQFHAGAGMTMATEADDRVIYDTDTGRLFFDRDGTGAATAVLFAVLENQPLDLSAADFVVI